MHKKKVFLYFKCIFLKAQRHISWNINGFFEKHKSYLINMEENNKQEKYNDYSIRDYFKEHPGTLLTIASLSAAFVGFLGNLFGYIADLQFCNYWGISSRYISENSVVFKNLFIMMLLYAVVLGVINNSFSSKTEANEYNAEALKLLKALNENQIKAFESWLHQLKEMKIDDIDSDMSSRINSTVKKIEKYKSDSENLKERILKQNKKVWNSWIKQTILYFFVYLALILMLNGILAPGGSLIVIISSTLSAVANILIVSHLQNKYVKEKLAVAYSKISTNFKGNDHLQEKFDAIDSVQTQFINERSYTNHKIINLIITSVSILATTFVLLYVHQFTSIRLQKSFYIAKVEDKNYVVLWKTSEDHILKKCCINNNQIIIYKDDTLAFEGTIPYDIKKFKTVKVTAND